MPGCDPDSLNPPVEMRLRSPIALAAAAAALLILFALAHWVYSGYQARELQSAAAALVAVATARASDTLRPQESGAGELERLEGHFQAVTAATQRLAGLEGWRNPPLIDAAQQYLDEVHALLRRQIAVLSSRHAVLADVELLAEHLRAARGRSSEWIRNAVTLKQQLERDFFDFRLAAGGLQKSFQALADARRELAPLLASTPLIEERLLADARARLDKTSAHLAREVEAARKLPVAR